MSFTSVGINTLLLLPVWGNTMPGDRLLLAQQVVDGLPPPPALPVPDSANVSSPAPVGGTASPTIANAATDQLFMVAVNGNSPLLLEQVRQVQPTALIQEYNGQPIILVGAYETPEQAQQQLTALATSGISASVTPVPSSIFEPVPLENEGFAGVPELPPADLSDPLSAAEPLSTAQALPSTAQPEFPQPDIAPQPSAPREIEFAPVPTTPSFPQPQAVTPTQQPPASSPSNFPSAGSPVGNLADNSYYIVIPGSSESLNNVRDQVILLGGRHDVVTQRERPLGPHVLVGPFTDRRSASRWNGFLRDFGLNARVYYRR